MTRQKGRTVYSTQTGDQRKQGAVRIGPRTSLPPAQQDLRVMRDKKGRKGKVVTVVSRHLDEDPPHVRVQRGSDELSVSPDAICALDTHS